MLDVRLLSPLVLLLLTAEDTPLTHGFSLLSPWLARIADNAVPVGVTEEDEVDAVDGDDDMVVPGDESVDCGHGTAVVNCVHDGDDDDDEVLVVVVVVNSVVLTVLLLILGTAVVPVEDDRVVVMEDVSVKTVVVMGVVVATTTKGGGCVGNGY